MNRPRWVDTFHDLHVASSVEELWGVLISWHGIRSSTQWFEAYELFRKFHADDPADAVVTAALLCTDYRWRRASHHLIARLTESGVLSESDEQQLAEWFVAPGGLPIDIEPRDAARAGAAAARADRVVATRPIWPPLRRWAAARLIADEPGRWRRLLEVSSAMASRDGAALAAGVMDAAADVPPSDRSDVLETGLRSGSGIVRLAALPAFAELAGTAAASARAAADPSSKVRAWTPPAAQLGEPEQRTIADDSAAGSRDGRPDRQGRLF